MVNEKMSRSNDDVGQYALNQPVVKSMPARYPVHDCVEFENAENLKKLIFVPEDYYESDNDEQEYDESKEHDGGDDDSAVDEVSASSSSSDENDSAAAAHAAAIGHSPQPLPLKMVDGTSPEIKKRNDSPNKEPSKSKDATESLEEKTSHQSPLTKRDNQEDDNNDDEEDNDDDAVVGPANSALNDGMEVNETRDATEEESEEKDHHSPEESHQKKHKAKKKQTYYCPHNLNERDEDENTPIHVAIHSQKLEHVELLIEAGASLHRKCDGSPPLHVAISLGAIPQHAEFADECVQVLHENDADFASKDDSSHTPLFLACMYNLPKIANFILTTDGGLSTLNARADRTQGRALHAAAKFDTAISANMAATTGVGHAHLAHLHHPDGSSVNAMHRIPDFPGKHLDRKLPIPTIESPFLSDKTVTQILVQTDGIELNAQNSVGQTPLHVACARGNWNVARILLDAGASPDIADRRGFTPGQHAHKRGMLIPNHLLLTLGGPPSSGVIPPLRDLIVDPDNNTLLITHELCGLHRTCPPIRRDSTTEPPPENARRLHVLVDKETGILRTGEFSRCNFENEGRRAALVDVFKCHEYSYVENISQMCSSIPDHPSAIANLDPDTAMSRWSFESALRAAGSVCEAVDKVVAGDHRNAFCVVRPPGHHAGPRGIVSCENDPEGGSHGFCFLNNVAIGAAYARSMYRNEGIRKIAIVDFDVHHGNGTEEIIRQLVPTVEKQRIRTPFVTGDMATQRYRPWLDETDIDNVFFASTHGYGPRALEFVNTPSGGWFYPASGKSQISDAINNPSVVETPNLTDFLLSQTWTQMGDDARGNCCKILNCGLSLPTGDAIPGMQRLEVRDTYRKQILPTLREFDPDIIFISAGFDAHKKDSMNFGYVGMVEDDYEWVTEQLVRVANTCCKGRIVSVLEGGYKIHGGIVSPFARSVASHVRALEDGGRSRELYDHREGEWESQFERHLIDEKERKRQQKLEKMRMLEEQSRRALHGDGDGVEGADGSARKRKRNQVDYRQLYEHMKREGFT
mmetsp:Transcript_68148/g.76290  ORF Transcript_68148/g.76290 Transcript_68148/m.76290 type:complete len:1033 (-) Transcript_68148:54-3152(-)